MITTWLLVVCACRQHYMLSFTDIVLVVSGFNYVADDPYYFQQSNILLSLSPVVLTAGLETLLWYELIGRLVTDVGHVLKLLHMTSICLQSAADRAAQVGQETKLGLTLSTLYFVLCIGFWHFWRQPT